MSHHISIFDVEGLRHCFPRTGLLFDSLIKSMLDVSHPLKVGRCGGTILWSISGGWPYCKLEVLVSSHEQPKCQNIGIVSITLKLNYGIVVIIDILYLILASQPLQVLNSTFKPEK